METPKFNNVKFKPFDLKLVQFETLGEWYWENSPSINSHSEYLRFHENTIKAFPELFEVEKAEREFEDGAYYKAMFASHSVPEIIQRFRDKFQRIGLNLVYIETDFHEIGEKIKL